MFYFRLQGENHLYIDVPGQSFDKDIEGKIRVAFTQKDIFSVSYQDMDGNLYPFKKTHAVRKAVGAALLASEWDKFEVDGVMIDGLANEDGEIVSPELVLLPRAIKKTNPYERFFPELGKIGFPAFTEEDIIKKQTHQELLHIYYRKEFVIYHIVYDQIEDNITIYERFLKS